MAHSVVYLFFNQEYIGVRERAQRQVWSGGADDDDGGGYDDGDDDGDDGGDDDDGELQAEVEVAICRMLQGLVEECGDLWTRLVLITIIIIIIILITIVIIIIIIIVIELVFWELIFIFRCVTDK